VDGIVLQSGCLQFSPEPVALCGQSHQFLVPMADPVGGVPELLLESHGIFIADRSAGVWFRKE
jgi:hypothetical protein